MKRVRSESASPCAVGAGDGGACSPIEGTLPAVCSAARRTRSGDSMEKRHASRAFAYDTTKACDVHERKNEHFYPTQRSMRACRAGGDADGVFDAEAVRKELDVSDDYLILGIDEAGRGPVIGPMVYTGAVISFAEHDALVRECHVADSKTLDDARRREALARLQKLRTFAAFTVVVTPDQIAAAMTGRHGRNLNTVSHETAMRIISEATLAGTGKLCAAYVDTVGPPETYEGRLTGRFPHLRVTVSKRADSRFPVVSAASIVAKVTRDTYVEQLGQQCGSGYPSDPLTASWLRTHVHRFFVFDRCRHSFVRQSWGPVVSMAKNPSLCVEITFEQDVENAKKYRGAERGSGADKSLLDYANPAPRRHFVFTHMLQLQNVNTL